MERKISASFKAASALVPGNAEAALN